jgi:hypothetical protein
MSLIKFVLWIRYHQGLVSTSGKWVFSPNSSKFELVWYYRVSPSRTTGHVTFPHNGPIFIFAYIHSSISSAKVSEFEKRGNTCLILKSDLPIRCTYSIYITYSNPLIYVVLWENFFMNLWNGLKISVGQVLLAFGGSAPPKKLGVTWKPSWWLWKIQEFIKRPEITWYVWRSTPGDCAWTMGPRSRRYMLVYVTGNLCPRSSFNEGVE